MSPAPKSAVAIDTLATIPELAPLLDAVNSQSWPAIEAALAALAPHQVGPALGKLGDVEGVEGLIEPEVAADPASPWAHTALAARYIRIGWAIRSGALAKNVSREQFTGFFEWLGRADELLLEVFDAHPAFAPAWSTGIISARGLQLGKEELWRRYSQLNSLSPDDFDAQQQALQFLLPKWFGSWEEARKFVDTAVAAAAPGSNSFALIPLFHIEKWSGTDSVRESVAQLNAPTLLPELRDASARFLAQPAALDPARVQAHSTFAMMFWLGQFFDDAAPHFRALDGRISSYPWYFVTESERKLTSIRDKVLKKAR